MVNLEKMNIAELRELATKHGLSVGGNRAQLISRITKALQQNEAADTGNDVGNAEPTSGASEQPAAPVAPVEVPPAAPAENPPAAPAADAPAPAAPGNVRYRYTPKSGQHLSFGSLIVPASGRVFLAPDPAHESFTPYYLTRTEEQV